MKTKGMLTAIRMMTMALIWKWPFQAIGVAILLGMGIQFLIGLAS